MGAARATEAERLDALRRRLYAPDVTEDDVAAYRAAAERLPADTGIAGPGAPPTPRGSRRRSIVVAGGAAALVAAGIAVLVTAHPLAALIAVSPAPTASATASAASRTIEGEVTTSVSARSGFVRALDSGDQAGLLEYLYSHSAYIPAAISTPRRAASTEYSGQGSSTIALDPSDLTQHGGRVTVMLVLDRAGTYSWRAQRIVGSAVRDGVLEVAEQAGTARPGEPTTATFSYVGAAPTLLALYTDETVKWGAVVVFTD